MDKKPEGGGKMKTKQSNSLVLLVEVLDQVILEEERKKNMVNNPKLESCGGSSKSQTRVVRG